LQMVLRQQMQNPCRNTALEKPMITHQATTRNNLKLPLHQLIPCPLFKENFNLPSKVDDSFCLDSVPGPIAFGTHCASGKPQRKLAHQEVWYVKRSQQQLFTVLADGDQHLHLLYLFSLALMLSCLIIEQINNPTLTWGNYFSLGPYLRSQSPHDCQYNEAPTSQPCFAPLNTVSAEHQLHQLDSSILLRLFIKLNFSGTSFQSSSCVEICLPLQLKHSTLRQRN
jgi:hypothetical protein